MKIGDTVVIKKNGLLGEITHVYEPDNEYGYAYNVRHYAVVLDYLGSEYMEPEEIVLMSVFDSKLYKVLG